MQDITKLQRVRNCLTKVVTRSPRLNHSKQLLRMCTIILNRLPFTQSFYVHSLVTPVKTFSASIVFFWFIFVPKVVTNIGNRVLLWVRVLFGIYASFQCSVSCKYIRSAVFYRNTFTNWPIHHNSLAYQPILWQVSLFIDSEVDQPVCIDTPLSLVSKELGAIEVA